jgi:transcriptional regulator with GAF, ATPase, and Fis domain
LRKHWSRPRKTSWHTSSFCASFSEGLIESELFGHRDGAFTGAKHDRTGWIGGKSGVRFFDEITKTNLSVQAKLLRVVETKKFAQVGDSEMLDSDGWFLFATNRCLEEEVRAGRFLEDLYYRISALRVSLPPLNERGDDAILLATFFIRQKNKEGKRKVKVIDREAVAWIRNYPWPGNVRELQNAITRGFLLGSGEVLRLPELFDEHPLQLLLPKPVVGYADAGQLPKDARKSLSPGQEALLKYLRQIGRPVTSAEVAKALGKDIRKIQRDLKDLRNRRDVTQERVGKTPRYSTSGSPSPASDGAHQSPILPAGGPLQVPFGDPNPPRTTLGMYGTLNT